MMTRRKACESGWGVCDTLRKVPTVGYPGKKYPTVGTFRVISHTPQLLSHALLLISNYHFDTARRTHKVSFFVISFSSISTLEQINE